MSYPTEAPDYPTAVARSNENACMASGMGSARACESQLEAKGRGRRLTAAMDDLHLQLDELRAEVGALLKRLDPVLGPAPATGTTGVPTPSDGSKFASGVEAATRKAASVREVVSEISTRLDF